MPVIKLMENDKCVFAVDGACVASVQRHDKRPNGNFWWTLTERRANHPATWGVEADALFGDRVSEAMVAQGENDA